jgi:hypothetical protein
MQVNIPSTAVTIISNTQHGQHLIVERFALAKAYASKPRSMALQGLPLLTPPTRRKPLLRTPFPIPTNPAPSI